MSERYGVCKACLGTGNCGFQPNMDCGGCGGTGLGGSIDDLLDPLIIPRKSAKTSDFKKESSSYEIAVQTFLNHRRKGKYE